jgi:tetratricopeptide (TPR) repeat protein
MISRRFVLAVVALLVAGGVAGGLWWWWPRGGRQQRVEPPVIDLEGENDPVLARAVESARAKVLREPASAEAWGWLGKTLLANGFGEDSRACFAEASRLDPADARWPYLRGVAQQAVSLDAALPYFEEAVKRVGRGGPAASAVRLRCAEALMRKGETAEARTVLRDVLELEPDNLSALLALGILAMDANDLDTASLHLLRCADSPLTRQRATTRLAALAARQGDTAAAERYRKQARQYPRDPEGPDPYTKEYKDLLVGRRARLLRAEGLLGSGAVEEAAQILQPLAEAEDAEPEAQVKLGMAWAMLGRYREAEAVLRRDLARGHDQAQAHYFLCVALFHQAEQSGARAGFEEAAGEARLALARKPDHAFAHLYLGLALRKLEKLQEAMPELEQAVRFSPEAADPHLHLGQALLEAGRKEEGFAHLEKAVELAADTDLRPREALKMWRARTNGR